jgi:hypothetical protein
MSSLLLITGIAGNLYYYFASCEKRIKRFVKAETERDKTAKRFYIIYVINSVNQNCGEIPFLEKIKNRKDTYIKIYVKDDYTDSDMENLRDSFSISEGIKIEKFPVKFKNLYKNCIIDYESGNFRISYDKKTKKLNIRGGF